MQTCIVHLTRASLRWIDYKDHRKVAAGLRRADRAGRPRRVDAWTDSDIGRQYPAINRQWDAAWEHVIPFFVFLPEVRKVIYTTNTIESIHYQLRKNQQDARALPTSRGGKRPNAEGVTALCV